MKTGSNLSWQTARNILCVRLDNLGDVLMTTPALRALRECGKGQGGKDQGGKDIQRRITLLCSRAGEKAARFVPEIDDAMVCDAPWVKGASRQGEASPGNDVPRWLAQHRFDAAVIFTCYSQSALPAALLCTWAGIPLRLAYCRENPYGLLSDWIPEEEPQHKVRHEVQRQLDLVRHIGCQTADQRLSFRVTSADRLALDRHLRCKGLDPARPWIVLHPGATAASRRYPAARFASVAHELARRLDCQIAVSGSADETGLAEPIAQAAAQVIGSHACTLAGELPLGEFGALLEGARLLVSNNSGPVHLAAALGTPVVDLYALTNPQHTPWQVPHRVLYHDVPCRFCYKSVCPEGHHACLRGVMVNEVVRAACELWEGVRIRGTQPPPWPSPCQGEGIKPLPPGRGNALHSHPTRHDETSAKSLVKVGMGVEWLHQSTTLDSSIEG